MAKRNVAWADTIFKGGQINDEVCLVTNLLLDAPTVDTLTAVRIIVDLEIAHGVDEPAADFSNAIHVGIGVASVEAFAVAFGAGLPSPQFTAQYPPRGWLYVNTQSARTQSHGNTGPSVFPAKFTVDLRAMRKIDKGVLFLSVCNEAIFATQDVDIWGRVRVLCMT